VTLRGHVQGVGFRSFAQREAWRLGLAGYVRNLSSYDGVEVMAAGQDDQLADFLTHLRRGPPGALVREMDVERLDGGDTASGDFAIRY
jgi:acylphosphatase